MRALELLTFFPCDGCLAEITEDDKRVCADTCEDSLKYQRMADEIGDFMKGEGLSEDELIDKWAGVFDENGGFKQ